jgi:ParB family transcriptional regulator, chromosome partitioning protein
MNAVVNQTPTIYIPLNRLKTSPDNVRKEPHTREHILELADSIEANGQLQNLNVATERDSQGQETGYYLVSVGEGRRLAQWERVARGKISEDHPIECKVDNGDPAAASLAENINRAPMHPADEFLAFKERADRGESVEEIAARFGALPEVVRRRLKLANVAPSLFGLFRGRKIDLQALMAFTVTDDHARQEQVWAGLRPYERDAQSIRRMLAQKEVSNKSALARFVGKAYAKAGGAVREDLFSDDQESFLIDVELVTRLANEKLDRAAKKLLKNGATWAETRLGVDGADLAEFGHVRSVTRAPTEEETNRLKEIESELDGLFASDQEGEEAEEQIENLEEERDRIREACEIPDPEQQALAGTIVSIASDGTLRVDEGLLKPADAARFRAKSLDKPAKEKVTRLHSATLVRKLTAQRTIALQATLARKADVALCLLAHQLAVPQLLGRSHHHENVVKIEGTVADLKAHDPDIVRSKAHRDLNELYDAWRARIPKDPDRLLPWLLEQPPAEVRALLALCVALTVDDVTAQEDCTRGRAIRDAAGLNMRDWWEATADAYFSSVPKARIASVLREAVSEDAASLITPIRKADAALLAAQRLGGTGWLPEVLR